MKYRCVTCEQEFLDGIPDGATQITPDQRRVNTFRFANGTVHSLRELRVSIKQHENLHRMSKKIWCDYCFPPPVVMANPEPPVEQPPLVQALEKLPDPEPPVEQLPGLEILPKLHHPVHVEQDGSEIEDELQAITTLAAAFRRVNRK